MTQAIHSQETTLKFVKAPQELRELQVLSLPRRSVIVLQQNFKVLPKVLDDALLATEALPPWLPGNRHVVALFPLASLELGGRLNLLF